MTKRKKADMEWEEERTQLRAELRAAVDALRRSEWMGCDPISCPCCDQEQTYGHASDCQLANSVADYDAKHPEGK